MKINVNYQIADLTRTAANDYKPGSYTKYNDLSYTNENLKKVFSELKEGKNKEKFTYMESGTPDETEIRNIVQDIIDYYNQYFAYSESEKEYDVNIRFYFKVDSNTCNGDLVGDTIRVFCKKFVFNSESNIIIKRISTYPPEEYFTNSLRLLLAHELFHFFHDMEYKEKHGRTFSTVPTTESDANIINGILAESFADYFAICYMRDFLPAEDNVRFNHIIGEDVAQGRLFGIGRKALLDKYYSEQEINQDRDLFEKLKTAGKIAKKENLHGIIWPDYGGAYILLARGRKNKAKGRALKEYADVFEAMMNNSKEEALKKMLEYKDEDNIKPIM